MPAPSIRRKSRLKRMVGIPTVGAVVAALMVAAGGATPADATQATGHDVPAWANGWSWTYASTFYYNDGNGTNATINETVTYTNAGVTTFNGQQAYRLNLSGSITGGNGTANAGGSVGTVPIDSFSGTVAGTEYIRTSDLALLQESQQQHLNATAHKVFSIGVTADLNLTLTPTPGWRNHDFPLNAGDSWNTSESVAYTGGFSYDSSLASGNSPFDGSFDVTAPTTVSSQTITPSAAIGSQQTDYVNATSSDGSTQDLLWYSAAYKNDIKEHLLIPMDGATLTLDRALTSASTPTPATTVSETVTPSLTCAGGSVTVSGTLSSHAAGVPVSVTLDKSITDPGQGVTATTTTGGSGDYSTTLTAPGAADGLGKNGARGSWGIVVSAGGASNAATLVVTRQDCSTLAYTGIAAGPTGTNATVSAQLTDLAGGSVANRTVTFALSGGGTISAQTNASGVATASLPLTGNPRTATLTTSYAGASDLTAASTTTPFQVLLDPTTTAVAASSASVTIGDQVTFTATVTPQVGSGPGGTVQFYVDGNSFGAAVQLTNGSATSAAYTTTALGDLSVRAVYLGDTTFATSTSPDVSVHVHKPLLPTTTTETVTPSTSVFGQTVTLGAHVATATGQPTGSVTFAEGATSLGTVAVDGSGDASLQVGDLAVGSHSIVARYSGDDDYNATSSAPSSATVSKASTDVTLSGGHGDTVSGEAVDLTAQVAPAAPGAGTPTGAVQLKVDGNAVGAPVQLDGGVATFPTLTSLLAGDHVVAAAYAGDDSFTSGSDSFTQHVAKADTLTTVTATPSPSAEDQNVTITANVAAIAPGSGSPGGTVSFTSDGDPIGAGTLHAVPGGGSEATLLIADLAPGTHTIRAAYGGDDAYTNSGSEGVSQTVIPGVARVATTTTLTSSTDPSTYGELITFRAKVAADDGSTPAGTVQFSVDGADFGDPVPVDGDGVAESASLASPDPGDHTVIAAYRPDAAWSSSGDTITQTVRDASAAVHLSSSQQHSGYGQGVSFTASVESQQVGTGRPTGFVQFSVDGSPVGDAVALSDGSATSPSFADLAPGGHDVTALYSGDVHFAAASDTLVQQVDKVTTTATITATPSSSTYGDTVTLAAKVTPATTAFGLPTGTVRFVDGSTTLGTVALAASGSASTATLTLTGLPAGSHAIRAVYDGAGLFAGATSPPATVSVAKRATSMSAVGAVVSLNPLGLPLGQLKVTVTSALGPVAGVPVTFTIGSTTACTVTTDASGVAICGAGKYLLQLVTSNGYTATFAGTDNFVGSTAKAGILK